MKNSFTLFFTVFILCSASAQQWTQKASLPAGTNRHHPVNFVLDYKAYHLTGVNTSNQVLRDLYLYDPIADTWTKKADFPGTARGFAYGTQYNGKGYVGFGVTSTAYLNDLWEYEPTTDSWKQLASCPCEARRHPSFIAIKDKIFIGQGNGASSDLRDWWIYDINNNTWSQGPDLPGSIRHHPFFFGIGDYAYVGFGHAGPSIFKDFYRFDIDNGTWTRMNDFPAEQRVAGTQQAYNGKGYILGGDGADHQNLDEGEFYEYDPGTDTWTELPPYPGQGRWAPGSFVIGNQIYLTSGETFTGLLHNDLWVYSLNPAVGINEEGVTSSSFTIFPNPVENEISLPSELLQKGRLEVSIFSLDGKEIKKSISENGIIQTADLSSQMYVLLIKDAEGNMQSSKFLKK